MRSASERLEQPKEEDLQSALAHDSSSNDPYPVEPPSVASPNNPALDFTVMVRAQLPFVWRLLRRLGLSPADADDAAQQVFLVAARRAGEIEPLKLHKFLYGTALRVAANARRGLERRREALDDSAASAVSPDPAPDELVAQRRARSVLDEILAKLTPMLARVLVLAEIESLTLAEIAELEDIPTGTAASRLRRAREAFKSELAKRQASRPFRESSK